MSSSISSGECTWRWPVPRIRISLRNRLPLPLRKSIDQAKALCDHCIGTTVHIAVRVGSCSASDFGMSSPMIIASSVSTSRTISAEVLSAAASSRPVSCCMSGATRGAIDAWA